MPIKVSCSVSEDGKNFTSAGELRPKTDERTEGSILETFDFKVNDRIRFVKIEALNMGVAPSWHKGAGGKD